VGCESLNSESLNYFQRCDGLYGHQILPYECCLTMNSCCVVAVIGNDLKRYQGCVPEPSGFVRKVSRAVRHIHRTHEVPSLQPRRALGRRRGVGERFEQAFCIAQGAGWTRCSRASFSTALRSACQMPSVLLSESGGQPSPSPSGTASLTWPEVRVLGVPCAGRRGSCWLLQVQTVGTLPPTNRRVPAMWW
jgi:hypothetical protein